MMVERSKFVPYVFTSMVIEYNCGVAMYGHTCHMFVSNMLGDV